MTDYIPVLHGGTDLRADELDTIESAKSIAAALVRLGYRSEVIALDIDFTVLETIAMTKPLAVFNLVESIRGDGRLGHLACSLLQHFNLSYTGAGETAFFQSNSKRLSKSLLRAANLPTPREWRDMAAAGQKVIVKSVNEHASFGMDQQSIVEGHEAEEEIARREKEFGGRFFAEAYIPGREFNISMVETKKGPMVLPIAEMRFDGLPEGTYPIVDYAAKWDEESDVYHHTRRRTWRQNSPGFASTAGMQRILAVMRASISASIPPGGSISLNITPIPALRRMPDLPQHSARPT